MEQGSVNVAYFANQFADKEGHGLARYARQLHRALLECPDINAIPVAAWSSCDPDALKKLQRESGLQLLPWGRRLTPLAWAFANYPTLERWMGDRIDVVHAVSLGYPIATRKPYVVTVHDIGPMTHPEYFNNKPPWIMKKSLDQMLDKADAIICVSQATADELQEFAGNKLSQDRVHIIGEGVSPLFFQSADMQLLDQLTGMPEKGTPFILTTGKISPRKNIQGVIKALAQVLDDIPHHLVLVGGTGWEADEVFNLLKDKRLAERVHMIGFVSDEQLLTLYKAASVYVHPSLFEGFGLTLLEAMAAGCPVITSNLYSLPEVAGDAAILVNPHDTEDIANSILDVCIHVSVADELIAKGRGQVASFSWENTARSIADVYKSIA